MDGDATAAASDLAHAFGAVHPEAGTLRAIHAVIDQLDNPASFARNRDAYQKHGASQGTFNKWKKKLRPSSLKKLTRPASRSNFTKKSSLEPSWKKRWTPTCLQRWLADPNSNPDPEP